MTGGRRGGAKRSKLRVGDVFTIPLDAPRLGVGQVVGLRTHTYLMAIFSRPIVRDVETVDTALASPIAFLAESLDAKIWAGDWTIVTNRLPDPSIPMPAFRQMVGSPGRIDIVDYSETRRRPSEGTEPLWVPNRSTVAPVRLEHALRASLGLEPWNDAYDELRPSQATSVAALFKD